ncbi:beta-mannosidase [Cutibacterium modestum P08]|nr:beta-mannosidase [Cutibacterium modestum P08]
MVSTARPDISAFDLRPGVKAIVTVAGPPEGFDPAEITVRHFLDGVCQ